MFALGGLIRYVLLPAVVAIATGRVHALAEDAARIGKFYLADLAEFLFSQPKGNTKP